LCIIAALWIPFAVIKSAIVDIHKGRLYPYYDKPLPKAGTYWSGQSLYRNLVYLDQLAISNGIKSLSSFGFPDGVRGEWIVWHEAALGVQTVEGLLKAVLDHPDTVDDSNEVLSDLEIIHNAFKRAKEIGVRFSFLIEYLHGDNHISWQMRWNRRRGFISDDNPWPPKAELI